MKAELEPCPFCGGKLEMGWITVGLHAEGWCHNCGWSMEEWSGDVDKLALRMNARFHVTEKDRGNI